MFKRLCAICVMIAICFAPSPLFAAVSQNDVAAAKKISASVNAFAFDLYNGIAKKEKGNIFFSPLSISMALALAYEGAVGETREEMERVLHFNGNIAKQYRAYLNVLQSTPKESGELLLSTAAWPDIHQGIRKEYIEALKKYYDSEAASVNFRDTHGAAEIINRWCYRNTKGKIKKIVTPEDMKGCKLALGNAAYFKADWQAVFKKEFTVPMPFHKSEKEVVECQMMRTQGDYKYYEDEKIQSIVMPYKNNLFSMLIILPKEARYMKETEGGLKGALFSKILSKYEALKVNLSLPRFKVEENYRLESYLRAIGMERALSPAADFSGITGIRDLYIDKVLHKAVAETEEGGSEAAAATVIIAGEILCRLPKQRVVEFTADHPFFFFIIDNRTDMIAFMGRFAGK